MTNHIIKSIFDGETYDLTTNRIQLFLLPEDVQRAMQKWPHGWETISPGRGRREARAPTWIGTVVYRCKPAPQVTRHESWWREGYPAQDRQWSHHTHRIIIEHPGDTLPSGDYIGPDGARFIVEELK